MNIEGDIQTNLAPQIITIINTLSNITCNGGAYTRV